MGGTSEEGSPFLGAGFETIDYSPADLPLQHKRKCRVPYIPLAFLLGLLTMAMVSSLWTFSRPQATQNRKLPTMHPGTDQKTGRPASWFNGDCGNSPEEAHSRGCRFNFVLHAWLPEDCLTSEDAADEVDMYDHRDWRWSLDNGTEVTAEVARAGDFVGLWTSFDWHLAHCAYVWKRVHRSMMDAERKLDSYTASYDHTGHCVALLSAPKKSKVPRTKVFAKFPTCA